MPPPDNPTLRIGDRVTVRTKTHVLWAVGVLDAGLRLAPSDSITDGFRLGLSLFEVCLASQYSAARELAEYEAEHEEDEDGDEAYLAALQRGAVNEKVLNQHYFENKVGTPLKFREHVQLRHVRSGKFLTSGGTVAASERENMCVYLNAEGSNSSHLTLVPRLAIDTELGLVTSGTELLLKVTSMSKEYLHRSAKALRGSGAQDFELNCSLDKTPFKLCLFDQHEPPGSPDLRVGNVICLSDPESRTRLQLLCPEPDHHRAPTADVGEAATSSETTAGNDYDAAQTEREELRRQAVDSAALRRKKYRHDVFVDGAAPPESDKEIDSNALWVLEKADPYRGGYVYADERASPGSHSPLVLRHLNTGRYLQVKAGKRFRHAVKKVQGLRAALGADAFDESKDVEMLVKTGTYGGGSSALANAADSTAHEKFVFTTSQSIEPSAHLALHPVFGSTTTPLGEPMPLSVASPVLIEALLRWVRIGEQVDAVGMVSVSGEYKKESGQALRVVKAPRDLTYDARFGISALPRLEALVAVLELRGAATPAALNAAAPVFLATILALLRFVCDLGDHDDAPWEQADGAEGGDAEQPLGALRAMPRRQRLMREQGILTAVSAALRLIIADPPVPGKGSADNTWRRHAAALRRQLAKPAFRLIYYCVQNNPPNQMYMSSSMGMLLKHSVSEAVATQCIVEMLRANETLQDTEIGPVEISQFISMVRHQRMHPLFLNLIRACCTCNGHGVEGNQVLIARSLLGNPENCALLLDLEAVPDAADADQGLLISSIYGGAAGGARAQPCPRIQLSWSVDFGEYSPQSLFGKPHIDLRVLYEASHRANLSRQGSLADRHADPVSSPKAAPKLRQQQETIARYEVVSEYLAVQLCLAADLCIDRNYVAIELVRAKYPYIALIGIIQNQVCHHTLRSAAVRLVAALHVDCAPQAQRRCPVLVRLMDDVSTALPSVRNDTKGRFAVLQQLISDHLNRQIRFDGTDLTRELIAVLLKLMKFRHYTSEDQIADVAVALLRALDERRLEVQPQMVRRQSLLLVGSADPTPQRPGTPSGTPRAGGRRPSTPGRRPGTPTSTPRAGSSRRPSTPNGGRPGTPGRNKIHPEATGEEADGSEAEPAMPMSTGERAQAIFDAVESPTGMVFVLTLVFVALAVALAEMLQGCASSSGPSSQCSVFSIIDSVVTYTFFLELGLRIACFVIARGIREFCCNFWDFYRSIDGLVVTIDIVTLLAAGAGGSGASSVGQFGKALRILRIARLVRVVRAAAVVVQVMGMGKKEKVAVWHLPARFLPGGTPEEEILTMMDAVSTLQYIVNVGQDLRLSHLLVKFKDSFAHRRSLLHASPEALFEEVMHNQTKLDMGGTNDLAEILLYLCTYAHPGLFQKSITLLMSIFNKRSALLADLSHVQLLADEPSQRAARRVEAVLADLERYAETMELWASRETEADRAIATSVKSILNELISFCRVEAAEVTSHAIAYVPRQEAQDLLRNLDAWRILMLVIDSASLDEYGFGDDAVEATKEVVRLSHEFLYWFVQSNPVNQEIAFRSLDSFIANIDDDLDSSKVFSAIFLNNDGLITQFPRRLIGEFAEKITDFGRDAKYLDIMDSLMQSESSDHVELHYEIINQLLSPVRRNRIVRLYVGGAAFAQRAEWMAAGADIDAEGAQELGYHVVLLDVLAGCAHGNLNINIVEAKLQALFPFERVLGALLDEGTTNERVRLSLLRFLLHVIVDVEMQLPSLRHSVSFWRFLATLPEMLRRTGKGLRAEPHLHAMDPALADQIKSCALVGQIVETWFCVYYIDDPFNEKSSLSSTPGIEIVPPSEAESPKARARRETRLADTMSAPERLGVMAELRTALAEFANLDRLDAPFRAGLLAAAGEISLRLPLSSTEFMAVDDGHVVSLCDDGGTDDAQAWQPGATAESDDRAAAAKEKAGAGGSAADIEHARMDFQAAITDSEALQKAMSEATLGVAHVLAALPRVADVSSSDLRYESTIAVLVKHVLAQVEADDHGKFLAHDATTTAVWLISTFRHMIETEWGMSIGERDEDGGRAQDLASEPVQLVFDATGVTTLCLDLIAPGIADELVNEAMNLLVALLFKEGGHLAIQETICAHLEETDSTYFFVAVHAIIIKLTNFFSTDGHADAGSEEGPSHTIVLQFLQLMCEGHFLKNQDILRDQSNNGEHINLLDDMTRYLDRLSRRRERAASLEASQMVADLILESIQGPCAGNQTYFTMKTELIETLNRIMRAPGDCAERLEVKYTVLKIFQALLEGQSTTDSALYEKVVSVLHMDVLLVLMAGQPNTALEAEAEAVSTAAMVLIQMLIDFKPALEAELELEQDDRVGAVVAVEVVWHGVLQRRFFHRPAICADMSATTKARVVENVDRLNGDEAQLRDFVGHMSDVYREVRHQQVLRALGVDRVFSPQRQNSVTWVAFSLACIINALTLFFTRHENQNDALFDYIVILNVMQLGCATFTFILFLVVRVPVQYMKSIEEGLGEGVSVFHAVLDPMTIYYFAYVIFCIFAIEKGGELWGAFLLLDIVVKSSTTADVLRAVWKPLRSLSMTALLALFCVYIFACFIYFKFNDDFDSHSDCNSLWGCFKVSLGYGLRLSGGIGDDMTHSISERWVLDLLYFLVILVILMNIIFGIIIDTFSELRLEKEQRLQSTTGKCFVCGLARELFDRNPDVAGDAVGGFDQHIHKHHNMWEYAAFIVHIWEQDKDDDDGMEQFVRRCIEAGDPSWFPIARALVLADTAEEDTSNDVPTRIAELGDVVAKQADHHQEKILAVSKSHSDTIMVALESLVARQHDQGRMLRDIEERMRGGAEVAGPASSAVARGRSPSPAPGPGAVRATTARATARRLEAELQTTADDAGGGGAPVHVLRLSVTGATGIGPMPSASEPIIVARVLWDSKCVLESETVWMSDAPGWYAASDVDIDVPGGLAAAGAQVRLVIELAIKDGTGNLATLAAARATEASLARVTAGGGEAALTSDLVAASAFVGHDPPLFNDPRVAVKVQVRPP